MLRPDAPAETACHADSGTVRSVCRAKADKALRAVSGDALPIASVQLKVMGTLLLLRLRRFCLRGRLLHRLLSRHLRQCGRRCMPRGLSSRLCRRTAPHHLSRRNRPGLQSLGTPAVLRAPLSALRRRLRSRRRILRVNHQTLHQHRRLHQHINHRTHRQRPRRQRQLPEKALYSNRSVKIQVTQIHHPAKRKKQRHQMPD